MVMQQILIVDGHSAIFSTPHLCDLHDQNPRLARIELHRELTNFQDTSDYAVVLVFDGKGSVRDIPQRQDDDIMVIYSRDGETADTVIERLAVRFSQKYQITVASNDRLVLDGASVAGALPCSIKGMWSEINR